MNNQLESAEPSFTFPSLSLHSFFLLSSDGAKGKERYKWIPSTMLTSQCAPLRRAAKGFHDLQKLKCFLGV